MAGTLLFKEIVKGTRLLNLEEYDCDKCGYDDRKRKGCEKNKRKHVFDCDCICEGKVKCNICGGIKRDNTVRVKRCPRSILKEHVSRIVPYFYRYVASNYAQFPDGRGLIYQPKKLISAFDVLTIVHGREEKEKRTFGDGSKARS